MPSFVQLKNRVWDSPTMMTWLSFVARSAGPLVVTPLVLRTFTPAETSLWFIVITISSLLMMADFGFGPSFIRAIAYAKSGRKSLEEVSDLLDGPNEPLLGVVYRALQGAYLKLAIVGGLIGIPLAVWSAAKPISELTNHQDGWLALAIVCTTSLIIFRNGSYSLWLQGLNRVALVRRAEALLVFCTLLVMALTILLTHRFLWAVVAWQLAALASSFAIRYIAQATAPAPAAGEAYSEKAVMAFIWPAAWRSGIGVLMSSAVIQASGIVYAQFGSPEQTAPYLFALRIMQMILQISTAPFYSKIPSFSAQYGANRRDQLIPAVQRAMGRSHWILAFGVITAGLVLPTLLKLIGSNTTFVPSSLWLLMGFAYMVERTGAMHMQFYSLSNHILWHIANGVSGVIYLLVSFCLVQVWGAYAFPIAMLTAYLGFYTWFSVRLACRHYKLNFLKFESRAGLGPAATMLLCSIYFWWEAHTR